jgi:hypothetical protein
VNPHRRVTDGLAVGAAGRGGDPWAVDYDAHPLLDPGFPPRGSRLGQLTRLTFRRILRSDTAYAREMARFFCPANLDGGQCMSFGELRTTTAGYLHEADVYLMAAIDLLPPEVREAVSPLEMVTQCDDLRDLMGISIHGATDRVRFEARRKLCLAQLLLQVEQSRNIQDGHLHKSLFEDILNEGLWRHTKQIHDLTVGFRLVDGGSRVEYSSRPSTGDMRWNFRSTFIEKEHDGRAIALDVLYYNCRFKRSVAPVSYELVDDGSHRVIEKIRWSEMRQESSGPVLSKMIRKGINNPAELGDIIGAMFIVNDNDALGDLLQLLDSCVGTPFGWRNVTDTLSSAETAGAELNTWSSRAFKVFKGDIDVLVQPEGADRAYRFPVEVQIYTLEAYLRTVCGQHEASHQALKQRQFLYGLAPRLFPRRIFGPDWLAL